jgi:hypothetical protein
VRGALVVGCDLIHHRNQMGQLRLGKAQRLQIALQIELL